MAGHAMVERCACTTGCRARRARSRMCSRRRAGTALGPASLACEPREQDTGACQASHTPRETSREGRWWGPCQFWPCGPGIQKKCFSIFHSFSNWIQTSNFLSKYPELQKLWNQFRWIHNFLTYPIKLFRKTETFSLSQFLLKLE
jgi:hypothetical protein